MLKHGIWFSVIGSIVLHAVIFIILARAVTAPQVQREAMETFIVAPSSASAPATHQRANRAAGVTAEYRATAEYRNKAAKRPSPALQEPRPSVAAAADKMVSESPSKSGVHAPEPVTAVTATAAAVTGKTVNVANDAAKGPATSQTRASRESQGYPSTLAAPNATEATGEMTLGDAGAPRFIHREAPLYPFLARKLGKEGKVVLRLTLNERGEQKDLQVIAKGGFGFTEAALNAVKKSTFSPALKGGKPVVARVVIPVKFVLRED